MVTRAHAPRQVKPTKMSEEEGKPIAITWTEVTKVWHSESVEAAECQEWKAVSAVEQEWLE
jgi:hypothetical protein